MQQHAQNQSNFNCIDKISFTHYEFNGRLTEAELRLKNNYEIRPNAGLCFTDSIYSRQYILNHHLLFRPGVSYREDGLFMFEFNYYSPKTVVLDDVLYFYRRNNTSVTRSFSKDTFQNRQTSAKIIAEIMLEYVVKDKNEVMHASYSEQTATIMPKVRTITIQAAELNKNDRKEILKLLKSEKLFPLFMYRHIKDWFPKAIHMNHSYMGIKGKVLDVLNFYSTTTIGFYLLVLANKLLKKLRY